MIEYIILGIIQGFAEWLPISSEGLIVLAKTHLFATGQRIDVMIQEALFLHLGTLLAAIVYFRRDIIVLLKAALQYTKADQETKNTFTFLCISTLISGILGLILIKIFTTWVSFSDNLSAQLITLLIGCCLLVTAFLELKAKDRGYRTPLQLRVSDAILLGIAQGCAALPGLSRSGLTISALLLRKFDKTHALRLSFLMSIPIVLAGNILLNLHSFTFSYELLAGFLCSFILGITTIHLLLRMAQKINFGYFVLILGLLTIASTFLY